MNVRTGGCGFQKNSFGFFVLKIHDENQRSGIGKEFL